MKHAVTCLKMLAVVTAAMLFGAADVVRATDGTWIGSASANWTNSSNWSASPYPGGDETATFSGAGNNQTTVSVAGQPGIKYVTFDGYGIAPYIIGSGAANSQTLILRDSGVALMTGSAGNSQQFNAAIQLGSDTAGNNYTFQNDSFAKTLTLAGNVAGASSGGTAGGKTLTINGAGNIAILGNVTKGGATALTVTDNSSGTLTLSGTNVITTLNMNGSPNSVIDIGAGLTTFSNGGSLNLVASQDCTINGTGAIALSAGSSSDPADNGVASGKTLTINVRLTGAVGFEYYHPTYFGTIVLNGTNDFTGLVIMNAPGTISCARIGNKGSTTSNLGAGTTVSFATANGSRLLYTGAGETTDRILDIQVNAILEQAGAGNLKFISSPTVSTAGAKTFTLQGSTAGTGEFNAPFVNGSGSLSLLKSGSGRWTLSAANTYTGSTTVADGTLALSGTNGSSAASSGYILTTGSTLLLENTASANNTNRLNDAAAITLNGATLNFSNDGGSASFSETIGAVVIGQGANTIAASQAASGQTATLTLTSLTRTAGTVNFSGTGLGVDTRNRILITGQTNGLIGYWATCNGSQLAAYDSALGVIPASDSAYTDVAARGPGSVITNSASSNVRINSSGTSGAIALSDPTTAISTLLQNTSTDAAIDTAGKTLRIATVLLPDGKAPVTVGASANDGTLTAAAAGDSLTLANYATNASLTVNAAVANNASASSLITMGAGTVTLKGANTYTGTTVLNGGALVLDNTAPQSIASAISGTGSLVKENTNRLTLAGANTYSGSTFINKGVVAAANNAAFGSSAAGTTIASGATLDVGGGSTADTLSLPESFTVSGSGTDGNGAIINTSNQQMNAFGKVALAGDTTFGGTTRWDFRANTPTLTLNNYKLTKAGTNLVCLVGTKVLPGTGSVDVTQGVFHLESSTTLNGSVTNTLSVRSGAALYFYNLATSVATTPWSLILDDQAKVYAWQGFNPLNTWSGPVTLNGLTLLDGGSGYSETFSGPVSGSGRIVKQGAGFAYLVNSNNTYAGSTVVSNGALVAYYAGSLPGYNSAGKVTVLGGAALTVRPGDGSNGWSKGQLDALRNNATFTANTAALGIDTTPGSFVYDSNIPQALSLTKQGLNTLTLTGTNTYSGTTTINAGRLALSNTSSNTLATISVNGGAAGATLTVDGPTTLTGGNFLTVGNNASDRSVVQLSANLSDYDTRLGTVTGSAGAIYQTNGAPVCRNWLGLGLASGGYGYYRLTGGTVTASGYLEVGNTGDGVMEVLGGTVLANGTFDLARQSSGFGLLNVFGGTVNAPSSSNPIQIGRASAAGAVLNISGSGIVNAANGSTTKILDMNACGTSSCTGTVNLLTGGTLIANKVSASTAGSLFFNFNGGTLLASPSTAAGTTFLQGLLAATVYPGGAIIDTTNASLTINQSLLAPTGYGLTTLPLRNNGAGYIGAPVVAISGGSGTNATAIASVDLADGSPTKGQVTGITVTSPGFGYQPGNTLTVVLRGGGSTTAAVTNSCVLGANAASGGLTKLGSGTLTLGGTNTYGGTTTISNGVLRLGVANALPANASVSVVSGVYDLNGFAVTNGAITLSGGNIINGSLSSSGLTKVGSGSFTLSTPLASSAPIIIAEGALRLQGVRPGLSEGPVAGAFNITDSISSSTNILTQLTTRMANTTAGWPDNTTFIYSGYIWNRAATNVTWTFAENFDDSVLLKIDGNTLLNNGTWNVPTIASYTLTPGGHAFEARFGQGSGGVGPNSAQWWTSTTLGFGYDSRGRNDTNMLNYAALTDPGDGSLLTLTAVSSATNLLSSASAINIAANAVLDLGGSFQTLAGLSGSGMVTNGTLSVSGTIAPGGTNAVGTLSITATATLGGTLLADVASDGSGDLLAVRGNLSLSALSLVIANPSQLNRSKQYNLITCTGTRAGTFSSVTVPDSRWHVVYLADGTVKLIFVNGTLLRVY